MSSEPDAVPSTNPAHAGIRPRLLTTLCNGSMMSLSIGMNLLPVFLLALSTQFGGEEGLSKESLGRLSAWCFAGLVIGIIITGPLADRLGAKVFALLGNAITAVSLVAMAFAPTYTTLCIALFSMGLGAGIADMVLSPIVSVLNPERRASALNWLHSFYCIGAVMTIGIGTIALRASLSWKTTCLILLPLPLLLVCSMAGLKFPAITRDNSTRTRLRDIVGTKWFIAALFAIFLGGAAEMGMAQWLPAYAESCLKYPDWMGGVSLLLFSVAMTLGRVLVGLAGTRLNPFNIMAWGCASSVVLFIAGSFLPIPALALAACIAVGFTGSCLWPTTLAVTADKFPTGGASMFGLLAALGNAGGIFMPWLVGLIADSRDLHWGLVISAVAPLIMCPIVIWMKHAR